LQLLTDYGLIYTKEFRMAVLATLQDRDIQVPVSGLDVRHPIQADVKTFATKVLEVARLPESDFEVFASEILANFEKIVLQESSSPSQIIASLMVQRLIALRGQKQLGAVFSDFLRASLLTTVRSILVKSAKAHQTPSLTSAPLLFGILGVLGGSIGAIHGLILGFVLTVDTPHWAIDHTLFGYHVYLPYLTFVRYSTVTLAGFFAFNITPSLYLERRSKGRESRTKVPRASIPRFAVNLDDGRLHRRVASLLEDQEQSLQELVVTLDQVCQSKDLCQWNPVQLGYLGHLEMLEAEEMGEAVGPALAQEISKIDLQGNLRALQSSAQKLREDPNDNLERLALQRGISSLLTALDSADQEITAILQKIETQISTTQNRIKDIRAFVEALPQQSASNDAVPLKRELILARLNADLNTWKETNVDSTTVKDRLANLRATISRLNDLAAQPPTDPSTVRNMASEILVLLEPLTRE
jgi:hypothetical protein